MSLQGLKTTIKLLYHGILSEIYPKVHGIHIKRIYWRKIINVKMPYWWIYLDSTHPRVLLTHIPLYRPDGTPCGSHRSSPVINQVSYALSYKLNRPKHIQLCPALHLHLVFFNSFDCCMHDLASCWYFHTLCSEVLYGNT